MDSLLLRLSQSVASAWTLEDLTRPLLQMLETVTGLESTYLTTIDLERGLQHILFARNSLELVIPEGLSVPWTDTLCKRALEEERFFTNDVSACWGDSDAARALGIQTYLGIPVKTSDGTVYGTLCAASTSVLPLAPNATHMLQLFAILIAQHIDRERLVEQLAQANSELASVALTDALTGLPNRRSITAELVRTLARAQRDGTGVLVGFIDLDGFKEINDTHGHQVGDQFLTAMAESLSSGLRAGDVLARFGGDEFVAVGRGPTLTEKPGRAARLFQERLTQQCSTRLHLGAIEIQSSRASVGVVLIDPHTTTAENALTQADAAMYAVKRLRRLEREQQE
ncbi:sensor domain-containing diguanylate cyclase [Rhodoferax sp.]|uniref:sensor domain-containing diguanylate cyclase n=1 Tax=Rhodoferax sp. TaxID=50421 RepID=UPI0025E8B4E2|nr:sensor domain-containing diguanylate cyclase [Rhodoferax sp.]